MEKILRLLADYPGLYYTYQGRTLTIYPNGNNGFTITIVSAGNMKYNLLINNLWHVFTCTKSEMVQHVINAISAVYRVKVEKKGNWIVRLGLEQNVNNNWEEIANTLVPAVSYPFTTRTAYWQNTLPKETSSAMSAFTKE